MIEPAFWQNPPKRAGIYAVVLSPLSAIWWMLTTYRMKNGPWHKLGVPVICVGNINLGGTGKTPTVIALAERLRDWGLKPHVVSRGYGGSLQGPVQVNERKHKAAETGDEPLLLAAFCPTWVARDRHAGAKAAIAAGADVILLDDGFQNPTLAKDISIVVVDAVAGFGNGRVFPAGPLREPASEGLKRADVILVIGGDKAQARFQTNWPTSAAAPIVRAELAPLETGMEWKGMKVLAFAGIGRPAKFFATVRALGANIIQTEALSDHQPLTLPLMRRLEADSFFKGAQMVTTEKDATRLPEAFKLRVLTVPVRLSVKDWSAIDAALAAVGVSPKTA
ncbi:MAG: tetraacyldisaccharide 4'-kinase [Alphaproteobacteria bacterium]|nr:tetraacyldisaccharide 4'-kinase [Alphaproteobacteria bacterium]